MTPDASPEQGLLFDLSARAKFRVTGADRLRFLNGQVSNDVRKARSDSAIRACVLNAKGKMDADVMIVADGESFLIDAEAEVREQLAARLERYIIADDVQIDDVSDELALLHVSGSGAPQIEHALMSASASRFGVEGTDIWIAREEREAVWQQLSLQIRTCDNACAEVLRIERGIPRWSRELTNDIIPAEAGLEASAIDFAKGCYIGQEVISRMKMSGQTNKRLCGLLPTGASSVAPGMRLVSEGKDVGWITSVAQSERAGRTIALGFLKRGFQEPGAQFDVQIPDGAASPNTRVEVAALPFV